MKSYLLHNKTMIGKLIVERNNMQQKKLNQVNHILKRIRCFCFSIFVVCLTLSVCVPVNAATATEQSVVDDTTQQETKKADTQMKEQRTIRVGSLAQ